MAQPRAYGEGRYGEGKYGGGQSTLQNGLLAVGYKLRLVPSGTLTLTDRKRNAAAAILGIALLFVSLVLGRVSQFLSS